MSKIVIVPIHDGETTFVKTSPASEESPNAQISITTKKNSFYWFSWPKGKKISFVPLSEWLAGR